MDLRAARWLDELPPFVEAVTVSGESFVEGTAEPFDPAAWKVGHSVDGWTVFSVTETSIRFKRRNVLLLDVPSSPR